MVLSLRQPLWVVIGLLQPILYLTLVRAAAEDDCRDLRLRG